MIYARQPTDDERQELKRMTRQETGRVSQRAMMILLSSQGWTVQDIAKLFDYHPDTIRFWIRSFEAQGPSGLYDEPRSGRPRKVTDQAMQKMAELIRDDPQRSGFLATFWTVAMMVLALADTMKVTLSTSCVRAGFHRLGLAWGRPRLAMPLNVDPEKARKQWAIVQAVFDAGPKAAILYADESRIQLLPLVRAMWHLVGQQIRVPTPGSNDTRALFGALNIRTGRWMYLVRDRMFKEDFLAFLEHLLVEYPADPIILIVDNFSSHTAHAVTHWLTEHPRLQLHYLPKYCSHLNPVEQIWLQLKGELAANRLYGSMTLLLDTVKSFFIRMTPEKALIWASM